MRRYLILLLLAFASCGGRDEGTVVLDLGANLGVAEFQGPPEARAEAKDSEGQVSIFQRPGTSISYYLKNESGCRLTFGIGAAAAPDQSGNGAALYSVFVQTKEGHPPVRIFEDSRFRRVLRKIGIGKRVQVQLPEPSGIVRLTLGVRTNDGKPGVGVWLNPRIEKRSTGVQASTRVPQQPNPAPVPTRRNDVNFLIVLLDAAGASHFGCYGYGKDVTPDIDRLASEGVLFRNAYAEAVYTQASVGSLLTSQYPDRHGSVLKGFGLGTSTRTVTQSLQEAGWETALITASPNASSLYGYDRGFGTVRELYKRSESSKRLVDANEVVDESISWMGEHREKQFFLYAHLREPHAPHIPPEPYLGKFSSSYSGPLKGSRMTEEIFDLVNSGKLDLGASDREYMASRYDENLNYADAQVGRLLAWMRSQGLLDTTMVVLLGDHGEAMGEHRLFGHNSRLYREFAKVPLIMRLPTQLPRKQPQIDAVVGIIDVAPTILAAAGVAPPAGAFQGRSLLAAATAGESLPAAPHFGRTAGEMPQYGVREDGFHYILGIRGEREIYDINEDPAENLNIADDAALRVGYMHQQHLIWEQEQKALAGLAQAQQITATAEEESALVELGYATPSGGDGGATVAAPEKKPAPAGDKKPHKEAKPQVKPQPKPAKQKKDGAEGDAQAGEKNRHHRKDRNQGSPPDGGQGV